MSRADRDNLAGPELLVNADPTFEWVRLAQRISVRIHIDDEPKGVLVSSGMTATVVEAPPHQWATLAALRRWRAAGSTPTRRSLNRPGRARKERAS
jgi:multidrug resistance efflux pump